MAKFLFLAMGVLLGTAGFSRPGDVIQVDHGNLVSYETVQEETCSERAVSDPSYKGVQNGGWIYMTLRNEKGENRLVVHRVVETLNFRKSGYLTAAQCDEVKSWTKKTLERWKFRLNDIEQPNLVVRTPGICEGWFLAGIELGPIKVGENAEAINVGSLQEKLRAEACPN